MKDYLLYEKAGIGDLNFPVEVRRFRFRDTSLAFHSHWHEQMELLYFLEGMATIECSSQKFDVEPGDLIFINSNEVHYGSSRSGSLDYYCIMFDTPFLAGSQSGSCEQKYIVPVAKNQVLFSNHITADQTAVNCVLGILQESEKKLPGYELYIKSEVFRLMGVLFRNHVEKVMAEKEAKTRNLNLERLNKVLNYIDSNYTEAIAIENLAEMTCLSVYHFCHLFKKLTGKSVNKYINQLRLDKAEQLLKNTDMNITEVAMATGFNDASYFSRIFSKYKNATPTMMRKQ